LNIKRFVIGLLGIAIPGSFFSTALLLSFGYSSQLVYTIGDVRQLDPLLLGIIAGSIFFSLVGYLSRPTWLVISVETLVSLLLLGASYALMVANSLILDGTFILVISLLMTSVCAPVGTILRFRRVSYSIPSRVVFGITQAVLLVLFVLFYSIYYETGGQVDFFIGPMIFLLLSFISFVILAVAA
jgi:hypothetical protein